MGGMPMPQKNAIAAEDGRVTESTEQVCLGLLPFGTLPGSQPTLASDPAVIRDDGVPRHLNVTRRKVERVNS